MVSATLDKNFNSRFIIRPNQSLSWRDIKFLYVGMGIFFMLIAIGFSAIGFWPILPFAGAELLALGITLYVCAHRCQFNEVVSVHGPTVEVHKGRYQPERHWSFPRGWVQVHLLPSIHSWYPSRLVLRSHGQQVELGKFLNERERRSLAEDLEHAIRSLPG